MRRCGRARPAGELRRPDVLRAETERLLADPRSDRFVEAFLDYWLDLRKLDDTTPSTTLYSDYYLDDALAEAALAETRLYFAELLRRNLPARNIVRLATSRTSTTASPATTACPGVEGIAMRRVTLPAGSPRGGLMTQASVLKVTANGTTTSPVLRGKWITERILGLEIPPPPPSVVAVEPDIRGAVTIRQQLDKHRGGRELRGLPPQDGSAGLRPGELRRHGRVARPLSRRRRDNVAAEKGIGMNGWTLHLSLRPAGRLRR